jgi:hypothetical protein
VADHREEQTAEADTETEPAGQRERRERLPHQTRHSHDDEPRGDVVRRSRWRFSSALDAARHLGST